MKVVQFKLADFGIGSQLLLVAAVPLLAISVRLSIDGWNAWQASCNAYVVATLSKQVPNFGQFIHELQQERAKSAVFLGAGGQLFVAELKAQRSNTDKAFAELGQAFSALESHPRAGVLLAARPEVEADAAELDALRKRIDALTPSASESTVRFTAAIGRILGLLSNIPAKAENSIINRHARAYAALVEGKEIAGQERALGSASFAAGRFEQDGFREFVGQAQAQTVLLGQFRALAEPLLAARFDAVTNATVSREIAAMRQQAYANPFGGHLADQWANLAA